MDAVTLRWDSLLLLVGPYGDWLKRPCEGPVVLVPEVDGLRLLTATTMSLLRRVPDVLIQVGRGSSTCWVGWALQRETPARTYSTTCLGVQHLLGVGLRVVRCGAQGILSFCLPRACCGDQPV